MEITRDQAIHFAKLSKWAYLDEKSAKKEAKDLGYTQCKLIDVENAQCMVYSNKDDIVLGFRGTEPKELGDIAADLKAWKQKSKTAGRVHDGFYDETEKVWEDVTSIINTTANKKKRLLICGHSLGGAMATIASSRLKDRLDFCVTFGSPRVGNKVWLAANDFHHHRFVNNNDIVPKVPPAIMGFRHHGELEYINYFGDFRTPTWWQRFKDQWRGRWRALKKGMPFDGVYDHVMTEYIKKLENPIPRN